jgi:hypothetical protein
MKWREDPEWVAQLLRTLAKSDTKETCERYQITRQTLANWLERIAKQFSSREPITPSQVAHAIDPLLIKIAGEHPTWGCQKLRELLPPAQQVSGPMIQRHLNRLGLGLRKQRVQYLVEKLQSNEIESLNEEQHKALHQENPSYCDIPLFGIGGIRSFGISILPLNHLLGPNVRLVLFIDLKTLFVFGGFSKIIQGGKNLSVINDIDLNAVSQIICHTLNIKGVGFFYTGKNRFGIGRQNHGYATRIDKLAGANWALENRLRKEWITHQDSSDLQVLNISLLRWLITYNKRESANRFPTFGNPPREAAGIATNALEEIMENLNQAIY